MINCAPIIKEIRYQKRLSQQELADLVGCSQGLIRKIEQGKIKSPSLDFVAELVEKLGVNVNVFIREGEPLFLPPQRPGQDVYRQKLVKYEKVIKKLNSEMIGMDA